MKKLFFNSLPSIIATLLLAGAMVYAAWTGPSQPPPGGNVDTPINTGLTGQTKSGDFNISRIVNNFYEGLFKADKLETRGGAILNTSGAETGLIVLGGGSGPDVTAGRVGWWKLDETSGNAAQDSSGSGNNGTVFGAASWVTGIIGNALNFDGTANFVNILDDNDWDFGTGDFTVGLWVKQDQLKNYQAIIGPWSAVANTGEWRIYSDASGVFGVTVAGAGNEGGAALTAGVWQHLAFSRSSGIITKYLNGASTASFSAAGNASAARDIRIGSYYVTELNYFDGLIDEVRIYNRALSAAEINTLYNYNNYTSSGKVGIGTQSPSEKLEVAGNIKANSLINIGASVLPGCSLANRGQQFLFQGASGVEDGFYICKKKTDGSYGWIALASPQLITIWQNAIYWHNPYGGGTGSDSFQVPSDAKYITCSEYSFNTWSESRGCGLATFYYKGSVWLSAACYRSGSLDVKDSGGGPLDVVFTGYRDQYPSRSGSEFTISCYYVK